jgi:hypothetical protein
MGGDHGLRQGTSPCPTGFMPRTFACFGGAACGMKNFVQDDRGNTLLQHDRGMLRASLRPLPSLLAGFFGLLQRAGGPAVAADPSRPRSRRPRARTSAASGRRALGSSTTAVSYSCSSSSQGACPSTLIVPGAPLRYAPTVSPHHFRAAPEPGQPSSGSCSISPWWPPGQSPGCWPQA